MSEPSQAPPVVVVTGPTATGKTALAIALAQRFDGEIINADSMQVYRYMDIGTAKASATEQAEVPHHLLDVVAPNVRYSAGQYAEQARAAAARIHGDGKLVILTGGTGLYIRAFLHGLVEGGPLDVHQREDLEREHEAALEAGDPLRLHNRLRDADPDSAREIHPNDAKRVIRALELLAADGRTASERRAEHAFGDSPFRTLHLALDLERDALAERIDARCQHMLDAGLLQEVRGLRDRGYGFDLRPMQAIGYRHMQPVVEARGTLGDALTAMQADTRQYARRQRTWLRKVAEAEWIDAADGDAVWRRVEAFLAEVPAS